MVEDVSIFKDTAITERVNLRLEAQFGNIFNRTIWRDGNGNFSSGSFGVVSTQANTPRSIQFGIKLAF